MSMQLSFRFFDTFKWYDANWNQSDLSEHTICKNLFRKIKNCSKSCILPLVCFSGNNRLCNWKWRIESFRLSPPLLSHMCTPSLLKWWETWPNILQLKSLKIHRSANFMQFRNIDLWISWLSICKRFNRAKATITLGGWFFPPRLFSGWEGVKQRENGLKLLLRHIAP